MDRAQIKALKESRARAWEQSKALLDEVGTGAWSAEQEATWAKLEAEIAEGTKTIDRAEQHLAADAIDSEVVARQEFETGASRDEYDSVFRNYLRNGAQSLDTRGREVLQNRGLATMDASVRNALGEATGGAGGYTVPPGFWARVTETMLAFGNVAGVANVITTATGQDLPWMTNDDTANEGAILAENTAIGTQDVTFGTKTLGAYLYTSKLVRVSVQLLQDSSLDIEAFLARKFATRLARIHNRHQTTGTGAGQPQGIVTGATTGKTTASSSAITYTEIIDLIHSVDPAYRFTNAKFMMNDQILAYIRKIKDDIGGAGLGRPLWEPSTQVGIPNSIVGYPYVVNQHMASTVATTNTTVLFGDFQTGYVVRNVKNAQLVRLAERYAEFLQVGFFMYDRQDAVVDDTAAYKALVQA